MRTRSLAGVWARLVTLVPRLRPRDAAADAWDRLHDAFLLIVGSPALAEDLARCSEDEQVAFLCAIARNVGRNARRSERRDRRRSAEVLLTAPLAPSKPDARIAIEEILHRLEALPAATRDVFRQCIVAGRTPDEAAAALGTTESAVRSHLKRMRRAAREIDGDHETARSLPKRRKSTAERAPKSAPADTEE